MSLFCNSSPSKSGPVLSHLAPGRLFAFLYTSEPSTSIQPRLKRARTRGTRQMVSSSTGLEAWFINSLVNAGNCHKHSTKLVHHTALLTTRRPNLWQQQKYSAITKRHKHGKATVFELEMELLPEVNQENTHKLWKAVVPQRIIEPGPGLEAQEGYRHLKAAESGQDKDISSESKWEECKPWKPRVPEVLKFSSTSKLQEGYQTWKAAVPEQPDPFPEPELEEGYQRLTTDELEQELEEEYPPGKGLIPEILPGQESEEGLAPQQNRTKEELMDLVDQYSGDSYTDQLPLLELPNLYQPSDGPFLEVSEKEEDEWPPLHCAWYADAEVQVHLDKLEEALNVPWLETDPEAIYQIYRTLPAPRAPYLESNTRHKMLHRLSIVERKDEQSMLRYLSVIDDMKGAAIPLNVAEWTSAISFVARYVSRSTEIECEAALQMWKEMEHIAGVKGNDATFNVLFDVACKAGKFTLAEMIYKEMENRRLKPDRYHHVSLIFYYGLQRSGDGARAAYKGMVDAGEMVDTIVLNAMISALIRSHETNAAENIYERMKRSHFENPDSQLPPQNWKERRNITRVLKKMAVLGRRNEESRKAFQATSIIAPDLDTFRILVTHFAVDLGDLDKTAALLEEMRLFQLPLHVSLFLALLKGFTKHGGVRYTQWTDVRLEKVWKSLLVAIDSEEQNLVFSTSLVIWALRAFAKCSGKSATLSVWEEVKKIWKPDLEQLDFVMVNLRQMLEAPDQAVIKYDWVRGSL